MADYIKREDAKLRIFEYGLNHRDNVSISSACENLERQMNAIPSSDVAPVKHGKNILEYPSLFKCSECGFNCYDTFSSDNDVWNFCPNCGAKLEEEE